MKKLIVLASTLVSLWAEAQPNLTTSLVICMPMNNTPNDFSGNNNNGTIVGGVTPTTDRNGNANSAYLFNGTSGYINVPVSPSIDGIEIGDELSISVWSRVDGFPLNSNLFNMVEKYEPTGANIFNETGWSFNLLVQNGTWPGTDNMYFFNDIDTYAANTSPFSLGIWAHYAMTFSKLSGIFRYYRNGVLINSITIAPSSSQLINTTGSVRIGYSQAGPDEFSQGAMDELRVYSRELTASEITTLYTQTNLACSTATAVPVNLGVTNYTWCTNASTSIAISANSNYTGGPVTFNWQPGNLTGQTVNVNPTVTTIYTVTATTPSLLPSTSTLAVYVTTNCCSQPTTGLTLLNNLNGGTYLNTSYFLSNNITLTANSNIQNSEIKIMPGVQITVPAGMVLNLDHVHLYACGVNMWQGIVVQDGGQITTLSTNKLTTLIEDAKVGIDVNNITTARANPPININRVIFNKNYIGIKISNSQPAITTLPIGLVECVFSSRTMTFVSPAPFNANSWPQSLTTAGNLRFASTTTVSIVPPYLLQSFPQSNLKAPYTTQPAHIGIRIENIGNQPGTATAPGVEIGFTYNTSRLLFNLFDGLDIGMDVQDASLTTMGNVFQKSQAYLDITNTLVNGKGINHVITSLMNARLNLSPTSTLTSDGNRFWNCHNGVTTSNVFEVNINYGIYRSTRVTSTGFSPSPGLFGITMESNRFLYNIQKCEFNNLDNGINANAITGNYNVGSGVLNGTYMADVLINQNYFGPQVTSTTAVVPGSQYMGYAITLSGTSSSNVTIAGVGKILSNKINRAYRGIRDITMRNFPIEIGGNLILIHNDSWVQPGLQFGILATNSTANLIISHNDVTGQTINNTFVKLIKCTNNTGTNSPRVSCNKVRTAHTGFEFSGSQLGTLWRGNDMYQPMQRGIAIINNGAIGTQGSPALSTGNRWYDNLPNVWSSWAQTWVDATTNAINSIMYSESGALAFPIYNQNAPGGTAFASGTSLFANAPGTPGSDCTYPNIYPATPSQRMAQILDTGVEENTNVGTDWNADVFPNPSAGSLYIRSSNGDDNLNVKIMDVNGSLVYSQNLTNASSASIDVSSLKAAIYFVEIQNSEGKQVRKKLIKLD